MKLNQYILLIALMVMGPINISRGAVVIHINQVAYDASGSKSAVLSTDTEAVGRLVYAIINAGDGKVVYAGLFGTRLKVSEWMPGKYYYRADFSAFRGSGNYKLQVTVNSKNYTSDEFVIGDNALAKLTMPSILNYYHLQRANTPEELEADKNLLLFGGTQRADLRGGWCDASGDLSKYFSHLAYANYMSPQQIPLVTWSMVNAVDKSPKLLGSLNIKDGMISEALYGADYMMRSLSKYDYFYMTVFSYFNKDPAARRVVGLHANSITTNEYQCAFREGGGMAIAALARIARWKKDGDFTAAQYLNGAQRAFAHLLANNTKYCDDGKENIIDDYCALVAASELWITTDSVFYKTHARIRAHALEARITRNGYFRANATDRPYWHASDAGLPIVALVRYLDKEKDPAERTKAINVIKQALDYELRVTSEVSNPFGYARQSYMFKGTVKNGFFIPHENETGWWWQGENARLGSLAAASLVGGRVAYPQAGGWGVSASLQQFAAQQIAWVMGCNPYSTCFMYQFGKNNVPYMSANFGHGSQKGGISNGITGRDGAPDGSGIDFKARADGNEWRWTEQWLPHAAWFLQALTAMANEKAGN